MTTLLPPAAEPPAGLRNTPTASAVRHLTTGGLAAALAQLAIAYGVPEAVAVPVAAFVAGGLAAGYRWLRDRF